MPADEPDTNSAPIEAAERPSWRSAASWFRLVGVFAGGLALDLWSKSWAFAHVAGYPVELTRERVLDDPSFMLPHHGRVEALPFGLLDFTLVLNYGAVFGIGQHRRELFIGFTIVATVAAIALFVRGTRQRMRVAHVAIGLILAGGLGNLYDRIEYGAVRDFLHMLPGWSLPNGWMWPGNSTSEVFPWVFNIADVLLLTGMGLFVITSFIEDRRAKKGSAAAG